MPQSQKAWLIRVVFVIGCLLAFNTFALLAQDETPTDMPTDTPVDVPAEVPTVVPSDTPTDIPTEVLSPTDIPTATEEAVSTESPTVEPIVLPSETEIPAQLPPEPALSLLVRETLDNGDLSPWFANGWALIPSNDGLALQILNSNEPAFLLKGQFMNVVVKAKFLFASGSAQLTVRRSTAGDYTASIDANGNVQLERGGVVIAGGIAPAAGTDGWRTLRLSAIENTIRVAADDTEVIALQDSVALPPGDVNFSANFPLNPDGSVTGILQVDDFFLWVPQAEFGNYPSPTQVPTIESVAPPIIEITAVPTEEPAQEVVVQPTAEPTVEVIIEATAEPTTEPTEEATPELSIESLSVEPGKLTEAVAPPSAAQLAAAQAAGNDLFSNATPINSVYPGNQFTNLDTTGADPSGLESGEPRPIGCGFNIGHTVWFSFTPTSYGNYTISLAGSQFDTVLAVYTGSAVNSLTQVACNDDVNTSSFSSFLTFNVPNPGVNPYPTYHIQVSGFQQDYGVYSILLQKVGAPAAGKPTLLAPATSAITANLTPSFSWSTSVNSVSYEIQISPASNFASYVGGTPLVASSTNYTPTALAAGLNGAAKVYYWRVRGLNSNGTPGLYAATRIFYVRTAGPTQTGPAVNAVLATVRPTLSYVSYSTGATYIIELSDTGDFITDIDKTYGVSPTIATTAFVVPDSLHQGDWYWRVTAKDALALGTNLTSPSSIRKFTINLQKTPLVNALFTTATTVNVMFSWYPTFPAPTVTQVYTAEVADSSTFSNIVGTCQPTTPPGLACPVMSLSPGNFYWRVVVTGLDDTDPSLVPSRAFTVSPVKPPAPLLVSPAVNATTASQTPALDWDDPVVDGGPFTYNVQICTLITCTAASMVGGAGATGIPASNFTVATSLNAGVNGVGKAYYWRVQAVNNYGIAGSYSAARKFIVRTLPPALGLPLDGASTPDTTPMLTWLAFAGATYNLQIADNPDFTGTLLADQSDIAALTFTQPTDLAQGTYYWHVQAADGTPAHTPTNFSAPRHFTVGPMAPVAPGLTSPNHMSTIADTTPTFTWNASVSTLGTPYNYEIQYANNSTFTLNVVNVVVQPPDTLNYTPGALDAGLNGVGKVYYWRVRTINQYGGAGAYSAYRYFTIRTAGATPKTPTDGAITTDTTPMLTWLAYPGSTLYNIRVDTDSSCDDSIGTFTSASLTFTPALLNQGTYFWCVQARDYLNNGESLSNFGSIRSFTIKLPTTPANNAITTDTTPLFVWAAAGVIGAKYQLEIDDDANFETDDPILYTAPVPLTTTTFTLPTPIGPNSGYGIFYWRVKVSTDGGLNYNPVTPPYHKLTITPALPTSPVLSLPTNVSTIWTTTPTLTWKPSAAGLPVEYQIQADDSAAFTTLDFSGTLAAGSCTTACSIPVSPALTVNKTYYWRVRGKNVYNIYGSFSAVFRFTIRNQVAPTLSTPANGSTSALNMPTFTWIKPPGAVKYDIQLSNAPPASESNPGPIQITTNSFRPTAPLLNDTYYWRVRAYDVLGTVSDWSTLRTVKIVTAKGGAPLANRFAPDNPVGYQIPRLTWGPISWTSPAGWYEVVIANNVNFTNPIYQSPQNNSVLPTGTQSITEGTFPVLPNGFYYWRVRACQDAIHCGSWSFTGSFSVDR